MFDYMLLLVGEQPIPNLLPVLFLKPKNVILVYSERTKEQTNNLTQLLENKGIHCDRQKVDAYQISAATQIMQDAVKGISDKLIINLTGATKLMSIAAYELARINQVSFVYLESEKCKSLLHFYTPNDSSFLLTDTQELDELITLDDYFRCYGLEYSDGKYGSGSGQWFEKSVVSTLQKAGFEVKCCVIFDRFGKQLEIDVVVRLKNQLGVLECKDSARNPKKGIDQLNTAGGREFLGTYIGKFLVCTHPMNNDLKELALARGIELIELLSSSSPSLSTTDEIKLTETIRKKLS
jgi:Holliday junction resolvase